MHKITLFILAAVLAVAYAEGQYYVPRAYYTIDAEGHESARVPLRRLRRSAAPIPVARAHESNGAHAEGKAQVHVDALVDHKFRPRPEKRWRCPGCSDWYPGGHGGSDWYPEDKNYYGATNPAAGH